MTNYAKYKQASDDMNVDVKEKMNAAIDIGIATVGSIEALNAALLAQHTLCHDFFMIITKTYQRCVERGIEPMLPLTPEVIESFNNAAGSCQMVAEFMKRGVLDHVKDKDE